MQFICALSSDEYLAFERPILPLDQMVAPLVTAVFLSYSLFGQALQIFPWNT